MIKSIALLTLIVAASRAGAADLPALLTAVAANARFDAPARADVRIECSEPCPRAGTQAVFLGRGDALYVETKNGLRALVRPGQVFVAEDGKATEAAAGRTFADTELLLEDLAVFTPASLKVPQVSDDSPAGIVVTSAPGERSAYALLVHTIDPADKVIVRSNYYRDSVSNLVKIRHDSAAVKVGGHPRPGEITVEKIRGPTTTLKLAWRDAPEAPATLFEPAGLATPSGLAWP